MLISPKIELDSVFIPVDFSRVTEKRETETSFEVRSVFWLRRKTLEGGLESRKNMGFERDIPGFRSSSGLTGV